MKTILSFSALLLSCVALSGIADTLQTADDTLYRNLDKAKGWSIEYKLELTTPAHEARHTTTHLASSKNTVSFLVIPADSKIYPEFSDFGDRVHRDTGKAKTGKDFGSDLALDAALTAGVGIVALPIVLIRDIKKYKQSYSTEYPNHDLQDAIVVSKNANGDIVKICDSQSVVTDHPTKTFFEKFSAYNPERFDKYIKKKHKFSIVEFNPECFTTSEKRMLVLYTYAKSKNNGFRYGKTTVDDDLKQLIAKDFNLEYK